MIIACGSRHHLAEAVAVGWPADAQCVEHAHLLAGYFMELGQEVGGMDHYST